MVSLQRGKMASLSHLQMSHRSPLEIMAFKARSEEVKNTYYNELLTCMLEFRETILLPVQQIQL